MAGTSAHPITITPIDGEVVIRHKDHDIVRTRSALSIQEASYPAVLYIPRADANMAFFTANPRSTHCPYKGDASYFDLPGDVAAVWSYENPSDDMKDIAGHLAFYPAKVEIIAPKQ